MDIYEAMNRRCSVRSYQDRPVDEGTLRRILEAGRIAPTAKNRQEFRIVVVREESTRKKLAAAAGQPFVGSAPVILAVVGLTPEARMYCGVPTDPVDGAIVIDHMILAATAEGLGTCWIGHFDQDKCREILGVPDMARIIELVPLGYAAGKGGAKTRKALEDLVRNERY